MADKQYQNIQDIMSWPNQDNSWNIQNPQPTQDNVQQQNTQQTTVDNTNNNVKTFWDTQVIDNSAKQNNINNTNTNDNNNNGNNINNNTWNTWVNNNTNKSNNFNTTNTNKSNNSNTQQYQNVQDIMSSPKKTNNNVEQKQNLDTVDLWNIITEWIKRGVEKWYTADVIKDNIKTQFAKKGYDVSNFDSKYGNMFNDVNKYNKTATQFVVDMINWQTFDKWYAKNSKDYQKAEEIYSQIKWLDLSDEWITNSIKNWTLSNDVINVLSSFPQYKQAIIKANKELAKKSFEDMSTDKLITSNPNSIADWTKQLLNKLWLDKNFSSEYENDTQLNKHKTALENTALKLAQLKADEKWLYDRIVAENPWKSGYVIDMLYRREKAKLDKQINETTAEAGVQKSLYDVRVGEINRNVWFEQNIQKTAQKYFDNVFNKDIALSVVKRQNDISLKYQEELHKLNNEYSWKQARYNKNWDLVVFDRNMNIVKTYSWFKEAPSKYKIYESKDSVWNTKIIRVDKDWNFAWSYVIWSWINDWIVYWWTQISDKQWNYYGKWDFVFDIDLKRTWTNVAKDTNNIWNIEPYSKDPKIIEQYWRQIWAIWTYKSPNWHTYYVFRNIQDWIIAAKKMIRQQVEWNSSWTHPNMFLKDYIKWYVYWPNKKWYSLSKDERTNLNNYLSVVEKATWADDYSLLNQIDVDKLTKWIWQAEWWWDISAIDWWKPWNSNEYAKAISEINNSIKTQVDRDRILWQWEEAYRTWWKQWADAILSQIWNTSQHFNNFMKIQNSYKNDPIIKQTAQSILQSWPLVWLLSWKPTWPKDMAAIFTFMKTLDPTSVVRESEYSAAANTAWILSYDKLIQYWNKLRNWQQLQPKQRQEFIDAAKIAVMSNIDKYYDTEKTYIDVAKQYWLPSDKIAIYDKTVNDIMWKMKDKKTWTEYTYPELKSEWVKNGNDPVKFLSWWIKHRK